MRAVVTEIRETSAAVLCEDGQIRLIPAQNFHKGQEITLSAGRRRIRRPLMWAACVAALCAMATIREILGAGTFCGMPIPWFNDNPIGILTMAPGGFFVFGCMIALVNKITKGKAITKKEFGCAACPGCGKVGSCSGKEEAAK